MTGSRTRATLLVLLLATSGAIAPARAEAVDTSITTIAMPGPGHTVPWSAAITNTNPGRAEVFLSVENVDDPGARFGDLLQVAVHDARNDTLIPPTALARLLHLSPLSLGSAAAGATLSIGGAVTLSRDAGNDLQGQSARVVFRLSSVEQSPHRGSGGPLADTGSTAAIAAILLALVLIVAGGGAVAARRIMGRRR